MQRLFLMVMAFYNILFGVINTNGKKNQQLYLFTNLCEILYLDKAVIEDSQYLLNKQDYFQRYIN